MPDQAVHELVSNVTWALSRRLPRRDLLAMLNKLVISAAPGSPEQLFAKLELAELILRDEPFRAARLSLDVLKAGPDARAYGLLGVAYSLLGSFRAARRSHEQALALSPDDPGHRHNLGHLLDVAFDRPHLAVPHLSAARRAVPDEPALATSLAHALARTGQTARAIETLVRGAGCSADVAARAVDAWREAREPSWE
jgi:Flp pilus assembly protein TadD